MTKEHRDEGGMIPPVPTSGAVDDLAPPAHREDQSCATSLPAIMDACHTWDFPPSGENPSQIKGKADPWKVIGIRGNSH